jgi:hypothetical protein
MSDLTPRHLAVWSAYRRRQRLYWLAVAGGAAVVAVTALLYPPAVLFVAPFAIAYVYDLGDWVTGFICPGCGHCFYEDPPVHLPPFAKKCESCGLAVDTAPGDEP